MCTLRKWFCTFVRMPTAPSAYMDAYSVSPLIAIEGQPWQNHLSQHQFLLKVFPIRSLSSLLLSLVQLYTQQWSYDSFTVSAFKIQ